MIASTNLDRMFGSMDIYVFDQLLRGRIPPGSAVLDAGCGNGRNIQYLLNAGYEVFASDREPDAISEVMSLAGRLNPSLPASNFRCEAVEQMSFAAASMDVVLSVAVLHFASSDEQFDAMVDSMWRVLKPGGLLFCRLASNIGMESRVVQRRGRRYLLPDGSERYLVDEALLMEKTGRLGGTLMDPLKTTIVQDQRCMTTWVLHKDT